MILSIFLDHTQHLLVAVSNYVKIPIKLKTVGNTAGLINKFNQRHFPTYQNLEGIFYHIILKEIKNASLLNPALNKSCDMSHCIPSMPTRFLSFKHQFVSQI